MDTNVPIIANGQSDPSSGSREPSVECRIAAVKRLMRAIQQDTVVLDLEGAIEKEYRRYLNPKGQPGVGDRFYREVFNSAPGRVERVDLPRNASGDYLDFPKTSDLKKFDKSDRKFAALSRREAIPVLTATDSDWSNYRASLEATGVSIEFVYGCDPSRWFESPSE